MESPSTLAEQPVALTSPSEGVVDDLAGTGTGSCKALDQTACPPSPPHPATDETDQGLASSPSPVAPSNTPIAADSGQASPVMEVSSDSLSDDGQKEPSPTPSNEDEEAASKEEPSPLTNGQDSATSPAEAQASAENGASKAVQNGAIPKETRKDDKKASSSRSKAKKREDKGGIDSILRALNSLESPEEKLAAICKKYADLHEEHRVLQTSFKTQQRFITSLIKERDQASSEHAKAIIAKGRLETLCRELQKHNKLVKEESLQRAKEDDEKRRELSTKFQTTIGEIHTQMNSNNERNSKLQEENLALAKQLKQFVEQYEVREQKMRQHRDLEQQVAEAKLNRASAVLKEEQERSTKEKELLLHKIGDSNKKVNMLEAQVRVFKERYEEFESLQTRSNETFQKYKTEMDKMGKRIKKLEKDGLAWKGKYEKSNRTLIETTEAKAKSDQETKSWVQKTKTLESLCRALQEKLHEKPSSAAQPKPEGPPKESDPPPATSEAPPNSPEVPSSGQATPDSSSTTTTTTPCSEDNNHPVPAPPTSSPAESESSQNVGGLGASSDLPATAPTTVTAADTTATSTTPATADVVSSPAVSDPRVSSSSPHSPTPTPASATDVSSSSSEPVPSTERSQPPTPSSAAEEVCGS